MVGTGGLGLGYNKGEEERDRVRRDGIGLGRR